MIKQPTLTPLTPSRYRYDIYAWANVKDVIICRAHQVGWQTLDYLSLDELCLVEDNMDFVQKRYGHLSFTVSKELERQCKN